MYCVYKHTCPNGKIYIGITCKNVFARWANGKGYTHNAYFYNAILKYGWDNIKHEILCEGLSKEEAEAKEIELIAYYKSNWHDYGYNLDSGGNVNKSHSEETKRKISESHKGKRMPKYAVEKMALTKIGNKNRLGKRHTEETKRKISQANKGKFAGNKNYFHTHCFIGAQNTKSIPVCKFSIDGILLDRKESANQFAVEMNLKNAGHIIDVCKRKRKTAYGYIWRYESEVI